MTALQRSEEAASVQLGGIGVIFRLRSQATGGMF